MLNFHFCCRALCVTSVLNSTALQCLCDVLPSDQRSQQARRVVDETAELI